MTSIFISSFDNRSFAWNGCKYGFDTYWKDCPYKIYFVSNFLDTPFGINIKVGTDCGWSNTTRKALNQIDSDIIIFTLEDYWFTNKVDTKSIIEFVKIVESGKADYIKLVPSIDAQLPFEDNRLGVFNKEALYRTSLNISIWRKQVLLDLLKNETIWEFETQAGKRVINDDKFLAVREKKYVRIVDAEDGWDMQAVENGLLTKSGILYLKNAGL